VSELRQILDRARELRQRGEAAVLATVVAVEGSAYRREGARMLIERDGGLTGVL
jgi:xanthine/CO dehydrogenase XdhC/CoxF family maturation factor